MPPIQGRTTLAQPTTEVVPPAQSDARSWRTWTLLSLMVAATAVIAPMPFLGNASGHDFQFHVASWMETARQWHEGILYPRWAEWANWGFGEPRFIFYPSASWMIGAAMGQVLPWRIVPGAFIWLALIAAGMAMWKLAREWLDGPQAAAAAVLYAVNPYQLILVYYRSDFAELLAEALFPLLLWGAVRISRGEWRRVPWLAAIFAGIWISNAPAAVMATYSLALAIAVGCVVRRSFRPLLLGATAMAGGFGLAAFYILPAAWEQRWVQIAQAIGGRSSPVAEFSLHALQRTRLRPVQLARFVGRSRRNPRDDRGCGLCRATPARAAGSLVDRRGRRRGGAFPDAAAERAALALLAATSIHAVPVEMAWRAGRRLRAFRRSNDGSLEKTDGVARAGAGLARDRRSSHRNHPHRMVGSHRRPHRGGKISSGRGYEGTDEYMPIGCDRYQLPGNPDDDTRPDDVSADPAPRIAMLDPASGAIIAAKGARIHIQQWNAEHKIFTADSATRDADCPAPPRLPRLGSKSGWQKRALRHGANDDADNHRVTRRRSPHRNPIPPNVGPNSRSRDFACDSSDAARIRSPPPHN